MCGVHAHTTTRAKVTWRPFSYRTSFRLPRTHARTTRARRGAPLSSTRGLCFCFGGEVPESHYNYWWPSAPGLFRLRWRGSSTLPTPPIFCVYLARRAGATLHGSHRSAGAAGAPPAGFSPGRANGLVLPPAHHTHTHARVSGPPEGRSCGGGGGRGCTAEVGGVLVDEMGVLGAAGASKVLDLHDLGQDRTVELVLQRGLRII